MKEIYLNEFNILMGDRIYLPSSSGMLRAYAESFSVIRDNFCFMPFIFIRDNPVELLKKYNNPSVAGFSISIWNKELSLTLARMVKEKFPDCLIIFGGPSVPKDSKDFLSDYPFIDISVHGEGEQIFADILMSLIKNKDIKNIAGISYKDKKTGEYIKTLSRSLIEDINILPSPYLAGVYNDIIDSRNYQYQIIFESMRGCPFTCSYCYWGQNNKGRLREFSLERIKQEIAWMIDKKIEFVFCADSNFGMFERDQQVAQLFAESKKQTGYPKTFRVCYGKNAEENNFKVAKILNDNGLTKGVTLSRQSNNSIVLKNIKRNNISMDIYSSLQKRYHQANINVYTEFILGLPGETYASFVQGIEETIAAGLHDQINIFFCEALPNTDLTDPIYVKEHGIRTKKIEMAEFHASKRKTGEIIEYDNIIIETNTMPLADWKRSAKFSWLIQILHGLKLGFFILVYLKEKFEIRYSDFINYLLDETGGRVNDYPFLSKEMKYFDKYIDDIIEKGISQCVFLDNFGDISWSIDEASYLHFSEDRLSFFQEFYKLTMKMLKTKNIDFNEVELSEVFTYQNAVTPLHKNIEKRSYNFEYNVPEFFDNFMQDKKINLIKKSQVLNITDNRDFKNNKIEFAKQIVWFSRKDKGIIYSTKWQS